MTWVNYWLKYANYREIEAEATRRGILSQPLAPAVIYKEITGSELGNILPAKYELDGQEYYIHRYIRDEKYKLTSIEEIKRFLKWNMADKLQYVAEYYDCDNFSLHLTSDALEWTPGLAFGIMDVPGHSKNICVTYDNKVWEIEPQADAVSELKSKVVMYLV